MAKKNFRLPARKKKKDYVPLWKIEDGITYSALSKWLECPEQFSLQWIDGLSKKKISIPLEFGSIIHYALENQGKASPPEVIHKITDHYRKYRGASLQSSAERDTLNFILGLAEVTFPHYCNYWAKDDALMTWVGREEKFKIPYSFLDNNGEEVKITLRGMRDGIYTMEGTELYGIFEIKTKSRIEENNIIDNLQYDMQTLMYCLCTKLSTGRSPNQIKYNVIRRPDLYRRKNEGHIDYLRRVDQDILERPDHYFKRYTATILEDDLERFRTKTLNPILNLFVQWYESIKKNPQERFLSQFHYLSSLNLVGKYGKAEMWDAIFGNMQPYRVRSEVFPELEESFQVTWESDLVSISDEKEFYE